MKCSKLLNVKVLNKKVPCILAKGHRRRHIADLSGQVFGRYTVIRQGAPYIGKRKGGGNINRTTWVVSDGNQERTVLASSLTSGDNSGKVTLSGVSYAPEYVTVANHARWIFGHKPFRPSYKGMPFFEKWNPNKGGSYFVGYLWIIENLGKRPSTSWSIDIIKHDLGFVPGNLRWALRKTQQENKQHRFLGNVSEEEFEIEAKRRGFIKEKQECRMNLQ